MTTTTERRTIKKQFGALTLALALSLGAFGEPALAVGPGTVPVEAKANLSASNTSGSTEIPDIDQATRVKSGKGTKEKPYVIKISKKYLNQDFHAYTQHALFKSEEDLKHYYRIVIPQGTYRTEGKLKLFSNTTLVATGARIYAQNGQNLLGAGYSKGPFATGYDGHKNITIIGGIWDGNYVTLKKQGKYTAHCIARFAHCTNLQIKNATFAHCNGNHAMEMAACKKVLVRNCTFKHSRQFKGKNHAEALQIDICNKEFGYYNKNGIHYACEDVEVVRCTFNNVAEGVGSHSADSGHPYKNIRVHDNVFKNFSKRKRTGPDGYAAVHLYQWKNSKVYNNKITDAYIGVSLGKNNQGSKISGNTVARSRYAGISAIKNSGSTYISKNKIRSPKKYGIAMEYGKATEVSKNRISNPGKYGVYLAGSSAKVKKIESNSISGAGLGGIDVEQLATAGTISSNSISASRKNGVRVKWFGKVNALYSNNIFSAHVYSVYVAAYSKVIKIKNNKVAASGHGNKIKIKKNSKGVAINASIIYVARGEKAKLSVSKAKGKVSYHSADAGICKVSKKGKIQAKNRGRTVITIRQGGCVSSVPVVVY